MIVMGFMTLFSVIGFLSVQTITAGWYKDVTNTLTIEIPSVNIADKTIYNQNDISQSVETIQSALENDPIIQSITTYDNAPTLVAEAASLNLPLPAYITLTLNPDRADNAEQRIIRNIQQIVPSVVFTTAESWQGDIDRTALSLKLLFGILTLSLIFVSIIMIYAIIAAQLKAHESTVTLVHLMGADSGIIAGLFQKGLLVPITVGTLSGLAMALFGLMPFLTLIQLDNALYMLLGISVVIFAMFTMLGLIVTRISVTRLLWKMP